MHAYKRFLDHRMLAELHEDRLNTEAIKVEDFIAEVKKYRAIWDIKSLESRYRSKKLDAWEAIARKFFPGLDEHSILEKMDVYRRLHGKWRNIRDSYVRCIKRGKPKRGYMYAQHLSFLNERYNFVICSSDEEDNTSESREDPKKLLETATAMWPSDTDDNTFTDNANAKRQRIKIEPDIEQFEGVSNFQFEDEDRSFFESLLPAVREFNLDQKLEFRSEILKLVKSIRCNDCTSVIIKPEPGEDFSDCAFVITDKETV